MKACAFYFLKTVHSIKNFDIGIHRCHITVISRKNFKFSFLFLIYRMCDRLRTTYRGVLFFAEICHCRLLFLELINTRDKCQREGRKEPRWKKSGETLARQWMRSSVKLTCASTLFAVSSRGACVISQNDLLDKSRIGCLPAAINNLSGCINSDYRFSSL